MNSKEILNELKKSFDEIKQKPLSKPEVYIMSWNEKYKLDNKLLCLQEENSKLKKAIEIIKNKDVDIVYLLTTDLEDYNQTIYAFGGENILTEEEYNLLKEVFGND